jgi:hypothetical protein
MVIATQTPYALDLKRTVVTKVFGDAFGSLINRFYKNTTNNWLLKLFAVFGLIFSSLEW